jgi:ankyrin repeat protein
MLIYKMDIWTPHVKRHHSGIIMRSSRHFSKKGANPNSQVASSNWNTALAAASRRNHHQIVQILIANGADVKVAIWYQPEVSSHIQGGVSKDSSTSFRVWVTM